MRTSLTEARLLVGSPALFAELQRSNHRLLASTSINRFIDAVLEGRRREHQDYFATVNLLEPNIKKSPGGLRDIHLLRWIALPRYGTRDPQMLRVGGVLATEDADALSSTGEFLSRIRNELHFHAVVAQDVLTRDEQVRVAKWMGFEDRGPLLGVERFMQQLHRHTTLLHDLAMRFARGARRRTILKSAVDRFLTRTVDGLFLLNRRAIALVPGETRRSETFLRLFDLARKHGVAPAHETLERVRKAAPSCEVTPESRARFLEILSDPRGLGLLVRNLHRVGLLGRFIPAFEHARCLMQFNQYHKYTVDEHSIRALEAATFRLDDPGPIGQAYRETKRKEVLHLALLLHDIGKGHEGDHSEVGKRIAEELAQFLGLGEREGHQLVFLVHKHLMMAHVATRRDLSDMATIIPFVRAVGTVETLRMLTVLTAADTEAVAPGSLTSWKESLFTELYERSMEELSGAAPMADEQARAVAMRQDLQRKLQAEFGAGWLEPQLAAMPPAYLLKCPVDTLAAHLRIQKNPDPSGVRVESDHLRERGLTQFTVHTRDGLTPGLFAKITGVLAAQRFQIVDAEIVTRSDGVVVDTFRGVDSDFKGEPPLDRRSEIARQIEQTLLGKQTVEALFFAARHSSESSGPPRPTSFSTQVEMDNVSSDRFTIVEVFADDRLGLLYSIARTLFDLEVSIASAKISTRLDQGVDVFYVTDRTGTKITDEARLEAVRERLLKAIP
jgi:[protein-PII] uridylyltransferase